MSQLTSSKPADAVSLVFVNREGLSQWKEQSGDFARNMVASQDFKAGYGKTAMVHGTDGNLSQVLVGIDDEPDDPRRTVHLFASLSRTLPADRTYVREQGDAFADQDAVMGWLLGGYAFDRYLEKKRPSGRRLYVADEALAALSQEIADAVFLARDLVNTPAADMGPDELEVLITEAAAAFDAKLTITVGDELEQNFPAIHAVGKGSHRAPRLFDLTWGDPSHPKLTLAGKGVVFDSGGLDIKGAAGMLLMKKDMGGAAVTFALARLIMATKLPVRLRLLIPCVENAIGPEAYRPGDVVTTRSGKTVEIGNTDAEGRVILCDALDLAVEEEPDLLIDMATLTGAARIALGQDLPGFWTGDDDIATDLQQAGKEATDPIWRMPLWLPYTKDLSSTIADMRNIGKNALAGSVTAALYLHEFVRPFKSWVHFDIYCWRMDALPGSPKGGEASALRAVYRFLQNRYAG